jgi:hypothetical protein
LKLLSTSRDRAIVNFILTSIYSGRTLKSVFGLNEKVVASAKRDTQGYWTIIEDKKSLFDKEAEIYLEEKLCELGKNVEAAEETLNRKRHRLDEGEIDNKEFEIANKKKRIDYVQNHKGNVKMRVYRRLFYKWKSTLRSQKYKGQGNYKIDRGAETAIYDVLAEQANAHSKRLVLKVYNTFSNERLYVLLTHCWELMKPFRQVFGKATTHVQLINLHHPNTPDSQSGYQPCVRKHVLLLSYLSQQKITLYVLY